MTAPATPSPRIFLTEILRDLCALDDDTIFTVGEVIERFGRRSFGALMFVFVIPNLLPLPPGGTAITGLPLLLLSVQITVGARSPWLPRWILNRRIKGSDLDRIFGRVLPRIAAIEQLSRPRLVILFGPVGDRIIGLVCTVLAFILVLPIPLMNIVPTLAIGLLCLGMFSRDGVLAILGYAMALVSAGILVLGVGAITEIVKRLINFF